jgi:hypothetical protein
MNWSAFFSGAPQGFQQGMQAAQKYGQNQQMNPLLVQQQQQQNQQSQAMNPLLLAHQGLQNQGMQQNISQGGQNFAREGNAYDAFVRQYGGQGGQGAQGGQPPQGTPPGAYPINPQQGQNSNIFSQMGAPSVQGPQFQNNAQPQNYMGGGGPMTAPYMGWGDPSQYRGGVQ